LPPLVMSFPAFEANQPDKRIHEHLHPLPADEAERCRAELPRASVKLE
jgi:hypothetical protein